MSNKEKRNIMIDFKATHSDNDLINYCNDIGQVLKTYPMSELEKYVADNHLNLTYDHIGEGWDLDDPNTWSEEIEVLQPVNEYIDENWDEVTEKFFNSVNKSEYKANETNQSTLYKL